MMQCCDIPLLWSRESHHTHVRAQACTQTWFFSAPSIHYFTHTVLPTILSSEPTSVLYTGGRQHPVGVVFSCLLATPHWGLCSVPDHKALILGKVPDLQSRSAVSITPLATRAASMSSLITHYLGAAGGSVWGMCIQVLIVTACL